MDYYKYAENAEILDIVNLSPYHTDTVILMKIRGVTVECFNSLDYPFEKGKSYSVYLWLLVTEIIDINNLKNYVYHDVLSDDKTKKIIIATGEGDCLAKGDIVEIYPNKANDTPSELCAIIDCGVFIEIEIPANKYKVGDNIIITGRLDIENYWKDTFYGSSPISDRF